MNQVGAKAPHKNHSASNTSLPKVENKSFWQAHFIKFRSSKTTSFAAYCRENQLNYYRALYWQRKLRTQDSQAKVIPVKLQANSSVALCRIQLSNDVFIEITAHEAWEDLLTRITK